MYYKWGTTIHKYWVHILQNYGPVYDTPVFKEQDYSNYQQRLIRESYINHFFDGAVSRIKEVVSQGVEETGSQELVVSHRQKAEDYLNSLVPNIKTKDYKKNLFEEAYSGYKAGYNANLSGKNLDKTKQKQLG